MPADAGFASYDTNEHPGYPNPEVDLSQYGVDPDPDGSKAAAVATGAAGVRAAFIYLDEQTALNMWDHYFSNQGIQYKVEAATMDPWMTATVQHYPPDEHGVVPTPPATTAATNREAVIAAAIAEADRTKKPAKRVFGTPWVLTAGDDGDYIHSLGRHQLSSTTAVIAQPGTAGNHKIELRQQLHIYDSYDYSRTSDPSSNPANDAARVGHEAMRIGLAKPYFVLGSGGVSAWSGVR
ncbi:hypothetical protein QSJ19_18650 [Gordonia sp. ABSL11-1]|uniref:hypothetical protein n=1 Tax=Gordonia sp. ABSL11-1 TaxID=3053924 RepID=UPI002573CEFF|nr:hypothetical protein [Gordonia sp. ABSL11-1]MDL9947566.1 hypothetical protein [Gordonia sp. ABSL11-1]